MPNQLIIVMRHGERRDGSATSEPEHDAPLTESGVNDVKRIASRLRSVLDAEIVKQIQLISSPFLRTLQTSEALKKNGICRDRDVKVDNTICEVFGPVRIKAKGEHKFASPEAVREGYGKIPEWGESLEDARRRYCESFLRIAKEAASKNQNGASNTQVPLLVTHGDAVGAVVSFYYPNRIVYKAEYLSFVVLRQLGDTKLFELVHAEDVEWILDGPDEHIKDMNSKCLHSVEMHPKGNEVSGASVNTLTSHPEKLPSLFYPREPQNNSRVNHHSSADYSWLVGTMMFHIGAILISFLDYTAWKASTVYVSLNVISTMVSLLFWMFGIVLLFYSKFTLPQEARRVLLGSEMAALSASRRIDVNPSSRRVLQRAVFLAIMKLASILILSVMLSVIGGLKFAIIRAYVQQISHLFSFVVFVGVTVSILTGSWYDIRILLCV